MCKYAKRSMPRRGEVTVSVSIFLVCMLERGHKRNPSSVVCMYGHTYIKSMDQPGKVANPARGQLNRENEYFPVRVRA